MTNAKVICVTPTQVIIECPYCGGYHFHGNAEHDINLESYEHRVSHCVELNIGKVLGSGEGYYMVTDANTFRLDTESCSFFKALIKGMDRVNKEISKHHYKMLELKGRLLA